MEIIRKGLLAALALAASLAALPAAGDDDSDHDVARDLYQRGEIRLLSDILPVVHATAPGDIIAVDLFQVGQRWVYQFQVVAPDGSRSTIVVDAKAATVVADQSDGG